MENLTFQDTIQIINVSVSNSTGNVTLPVFPPKPPIMVANQILLAATLVLVMLGMGCTTTVKAVWSYIRRPVGIAIGAVCQFLLMPLIGFALAHAMRMNANFALATLIVACCPGGTLSNLFCYYSSGDVTLSICMTTCSTILAIGMMPLSLFIYGRSWTSQSTVIPYTDIVIALVSILVPAAVGMLIRWKSEKVAEITQKICSTLALLGIITSIIMQAASNVNAYLTDSTPWVVAIIYPVLAFLVGYGFSSIPVFRLKQAQRRTVGFETGCQNVALALTIINLSFPKGPDIIQMIVIPSLFGVFMVIDSLIFVACFRIYMKLRKRKNNDEEIIVVDPDNKSSNSLKSEPRLDSLDENVNVVDARDKHVIDTRDEPVIDCVQRLPAGLSNQAFHPDHPEDTLYEVSTQTPFPEGASGQWDIVIPRPWKELCEDHATTQPEHGTGYTNYAHEDDDNHIAMNKEVKGSIGTISGSMKATDSAYTSNGSRSRLNISCFDLSTSYLIGENNSIWESSI